MKRIVASLPKEPASEEANDTIPFYKFRPRKAKDARSIDIEANECFTEPDSQKTKEHDEFPINKMATTKPEKATLNKRMKQLEFQENCEVTITKEFVVQTLPTTPMSQKINPTFDQIYKIPNCN